MLKKSFIKNDIFRFFFLLEIILKINDEILIELSN
jgi:hypothetical protein